MDVLFYMVTVDISPKVNVFDNFMNTLGIVTDPGTTFAVIKITDL